MKMTTSPWTKKATPTSRFRETFSELTDQVKKSSNFGNYYNDGITKAILFGNGA
jgi:hypothetical protein